MSVSCLIFLAVLLTCRTSRDVGPAVQKDVIHARLDDSAGNVLDTSFCRFTTSSVGGGGSVLSAVSLCPASDKLEHVSDQLE